MYEQYSISYIKNIAFEKAAYIISPKIII